MKIVLDKDKVNIKNENDKIIIDLIPELCEKAFPPKRAIRLSSLKPKDEFKIGNKSFIVLEQDKEGERTLVISKDFIYDKSEKFGACSDWRQSLIRQRLNTEYLKEIVDIVGDEKVFPMGRNLTSLDGLDDYEYCLDKVSLLTAEEYAKYHKILGTKTDYSDWWWLITAYSTPSNNYSNKVCCVAFSGTIDSCFCQGYNHIRPILCLSSSLLVEFVKNKKE